MTDTNLKRVARCLLVPALAALVLAAITSAYDLQGKDEDDSGAHEDANSAYAIGLLGRSSLLRSSGDRRRARDQRNSQSQALAHGRHTAHLAVRNYSAQLRRDG